MLKYLVKRESPTIRSLYRRFSCSLFVSVLGPEFPLMFSCVGVLAVRWPFSISLVALLLLDPPVDNNLVVGMVFSDFVLNKESHGSQLGMN